MREGERTKGRKVEFVLNLERIQHMESVNEIYEYILSNSTKWESINKNIKMQEWYDYKNDLYVYLTNTYVNKEDVENSLDFLIVSNTKAFKFIYSKEEDLENIIQQSRVALYYLMVDFYNGIYDNQTYRAFGFRINRDINQFKRLFLEENIDKFCSILLTKSKQEERKSLPNRVLSRKKINDNEYKTVCEYISLGFESYEQTFEDENKQSADDYLYSKGDLQEKEKNIEVYRNDNIYSYLAKNIGLLTDKQKDFINYYLQEDLGSFDYLFRENDPHMSKELKCSYRKNIRNKFTKGLLENNPHIKKTKGKGYFTLIKSDNSFLLEKIRKQKDKKKQFQMMAKVMKGNSEVAKMITDIVIDEDVMKYFVDYYKNSFTKEVYRFIYGKKFTNLLAKLKEDDGQCS